MPKQDLPSLNPQDDYCSLCFAEDQAPETEDKELPPANAQSFAPTRARFPAADGTGLTQIAFGAFDPEQAAVSLDRCRDLKAAVPPSAAIITIDQETHLPPARVLAPSQSPCLLALGSGFEALRAPGGEGPPASPLYWTPSNVGACGVRENDFTRPALHGFGGRFAPLPRNDAGRLMQLQKGDTQLAAFGRTAQPATADGADTVAGKNVPFAKSTSSPSGLSLSYSPVGDPAEARESLGQSAGQELEEQFCGSGPAAIAAGPQDVCTACGDSPIPGSPLAGNESLPPGSAAIVSPAMQIASCVLGSTSTDASSAETAPARQPATIRLATDSARCSTHVQMLHVQLEPVNLGKVAVKMRLSGPRLCLYVAAEEPETIRIIGDDAKLLSERLQSAGYAIEELTIRPMDPHPSHPSHAGQHAGAEASQEQRGGTTGGGPSSHDRRSLRDGSTPSLKSLDCDAQDIAANRPIDGGLYL